MIITYWKFECSIVRQWKAALDCTWRNKGLYYHFLGEASHFYSWTEVDEIFEVKCFEIERRTEFHYWFEKRAFVDLYEIKMQFETTRSRILSYIDSTWTCIWREFKAGIWTFSILYFCSSSNSLENRSARVLLLAHSNLNSFKLSEAPRVV